LIVVLTCRRPGAAYATETIRQINESAPSSEEKVLLSDGPPPEGLEAPPSWRVVEEPRPVIPPQNKHTAWKAFELAFAAKSDLCFFEDDLLLAKNAAARIARFHVPDDLAFVTFFSTWLTSRQPIGLWRIHAATYVMAQSLKFPLRTVGELLLARQSPEWHNTKQGGFDEVLRRFAMARGWRYGIHNPNLVQHVGETSAVGNGRLSENRVTPNFAGAGTDALAFEGLQREFFL